MSKLNLWFCVLRAFNVIEFVVFNLLITMSVCTFWLYYYEFQMFGKEYVIIMSCFVANLGRKC